MLFAAGFPAWRCLFSLLFWLELYRLANQITFNILRFFRLRKIQQDFLNLPPASSKTAPAPAQKAPQGRRPRRFRRRRFYNILLCRRKRHGHSLLTASAGKAQVAFINVSETLRRPLGIIREILATLTKSRGRM